MVASSATIVLVVMLMHLWVKLSLDMLLKQLSLRTWVTDWVYSLAVCLRLQMATVNDVDSTVFNTYLTYETGAWLFAAEYIMTEHDFDGVIDGELEIDSFLLMANYSYSDQASITGRMFRSG
jgi:hypothetical protein